MKVFFTASQRGKRYFQHQYEQIFNAIQEQGHKHLENSFLTIKPQDFYAELEDKGIKGYNDYYTNNVAMIRKSDFTVFECSLPSLSIGYMVQLSIDLNKPTVVLYFEDNTPHFLVNTQEDKIIALNYDGKNIHKIIQQAVAEVKGKSDKRFNFFIDPGLLNYLNRISKEQGITKSTFIRNLIRDHKKTH